MHRLVLLVGAIVAVDTTFFAAIAPHLPRLEAGSTQAPRTEADGEGMVPRPSTAPARWEPSEVEPREASGLTTRLILAYVESKGGSPA